MREGGRDLPKNNIKIAGPISRCELDENRRDFYEFVMQTIIQKQDDSFKCKFDHLKE